MEHFSSPSTYFNAARKPEFMIRVLFCCLLLSILISESSSLCLASTNVTDDGGKSVQLQIYAPPENAAFHFTLVEKDRQQLTLYRQRGQLETVITLPCATGENPGNKRTSGDSRTPEGIYFITEIYEDSKITVFGSRAFHLDYPNVFDIHAGRLGDGIFIHGTNKNLVPNSTNGCITLNNRDLENLAPYLVVDHLPVIIVKSLSGNEDAMVTSLTETSPHFHQILELLSLGDEHIATERISTLYLLEVDNQAIASIKYDQMDGDTLRLSYQKKSYLTAGLQQPWRVVQSIHSQDPFPLILARLPIKHRSPVMAAISSNKNDPGKKPSKQPHVKKTGAELLTFVEKWRKAWESKDLQTYMSCYSPTFVSGKLDKEAWRRKKSYLNRKYSFISVSIRNIIVEWTKDGANVSFHQNYMSDQYQSSGTKVLQLLHRNNSWLINREIM